MEKRLIFIVHKIKFMYKMIHKYNKSSNKDIIILCSHLEINKKNPLKTRKQIYRE